MIPLTEARAYIIERCPAPVPIQVDLTDARGLVLAASVSSPEDVPPFANTAMDGFALRAADTVGAPVDLEVAGTVAAGVDPIAEGITVAAGTASRIMTGAPMPPGADAVVMVERTEDIGDDRIRIEVEVPVGNHVRHPGEDLAVGDEAFPAGTTLGPGHLGVLASIGIERVPVWRRLRVGVMSTGDELAEGAGQLARGQIRDANRPSLLGLLGEMGTEPVDLGWVPDDEDAIAQTLVDGVAACDALLTSGGVSMGDFDYVKVVLDRIGDMRWMQVAIKPAKPLAFGLVDDVPVFGLPGNPVSSMVSFELFARPALRAMGGHTELDRRRVLAVVDGGLSRRPDGKVHFARVRTAVVDGRFRVVSAGGQGSHHLTAMAAADGLAVLPDGDGLADGEEVEVILLS
ncbi:MAG TPA: molybdopterin molybdenumtransferase MoeA [Acidimicrobiaceae bacterium]|nr:molybdopterin molybdenumtransferase MoeA [Acidimicrobiaceae bacterium]